MTVPSDTDLGVDLATGPTTTAPAPPSSTASATAEAGPDAPTQAAPIVTGNQAVSMAGQVARGSLWSMGGQSVTLLASLLATPLLIRWLGAEAYGVWALINLLIGYLSFGDLGMGTASTRFGAEAHARGDDKGEAEIIWTALLLGLLPAMLLAVLLVFGAAPLLARVLGLPAHLQPEAVLALRIAALGFIARVAASVLNTPQLVRLRLRLNVAINTTAGVAQIALAPLALRLGGGLAGAALAVTAVNGFAALGHAFFSWRLLPQLRQPGFARTRAHALARFGGALVLSQLAALLLTNGEKLVLTRVASVKTLAYYSVAFTLANLLTMAPVALGQALLPAFTRLWASASAAELQAFYQHALRWLLLGTPPVLLLMAWGARPFLTLWAGPEFGRESSGPFYVLLAGLAVNVVAYVPLNLMIAAGRTQLLARYYWLELLPYLLLAGLLAARFGAIGAAAAWSVRAATDAILYLRTGNRLAKLSRPLLAEAGKSYFLLLSVLFAPVLLVKLLVSNPGLELLALLAGLFSYGILAWTYLLQSGERRWLTERLSLDLK